MEVRLVALIGGGLVTHVCGVYRAVVVHNTDPLGLGRVQVKCPQLFGSEALTDWMICSIPAGSYSTVPAAGTQGYIGFEAGDTDHPVWLGNTGVFPTPPTNKLPSGTEVQGDLVVDGNATIAGAITVSSTGSSFSGITKFANATVTGQLLALGGINTNSQPINNLSAGVLNTDAVNLLQMNNAILLAVPTAVRARSWQQAAWTPTIGSTTQLLIDTVAYSVGAGFNSNSFIAPAIGYYHVSATVGAATTTAVAATIQIYVYLNGALSMSGSVGGAPATSGLAIASNVSGTVHMNTSDVITLYYLVSAGSSVSGQTGAATFITVDKLV